VSITWETNEALWNALLEVRAWLVGDYLHKINHASEITAEDSRPLTEAWERVSAGEFALYEDIFRSSQSAIRSLYERLEDFAATMNLEISARMAGDDARRGEHHEDAGRKYKELVLAYTADLHAIQKLLEVHQREQPRISLPSLQSVGGAIIIQSPNAQQSRTVVKASEGSTVNIDRSRKDDHSTHISSSIQNSPGAVANVGQTLSNLTTNVRNTIARSGQSDEVKALIQQLAEQIAAVGRAGAAGAAAAPGGPGAGQVAAGGAAAGSEAGTGEGAGALAARESAVVGELASDCQTLAEELAKPKPRRKWWELSLEGVKEAAQALGEVGVPIVKTAMKLAALLG
jgi:hypothetical protein